MDRSERTVHRGEIYYADLNPVVGSEQGGIRPVLILQNEVGNWFSPTVIVAAVTAKGGKARLPTHVPVGTDSGLDSCRVSFFAMLSLLSTLNLTLPEAVTLDGFKVLASADIFCSAVLSETVTGLRIVTVFPLLSTVTVSQTA